MMEYLMHFPKIRRRILLILVGGSFLLAAFFGYAAIKLWWDDMHAPDAPVPMSIEEAAERSQDDDLWVALQDTEGFQWDCSTMIYYTEESTEKEWMDILVTDPARSIVLIVILKNQRTCGELQASLPALSGELSQVSGHDFDDLNYDGRLFAYPESTTFLRLCTYCDPNNAKTFIPVSLFCLVGSVIVMGYSFYELRQTQKLIAAQETESSVNFR
jgi:hypothetical protein